MTANTLPLHEVLAAVHETVLKGIEKDITRWKRKSNKAKSLEDQLDCQKHIRHFQSLRSHMRQGLFDLQDQLSTLPTTYPSMEAKVEAVLALVLQHQQTHNGPKPKPNNPT